MGLGRQRPQEVRMLRHTLRVDGEIARGLARMSQAERREWLREAVLDHADFASWAISAVKHIEANPSAGFLAARWLSTAYMAYVSSGGRYGYPARQDLEAPAATDLQGPLRKRGALRLRRRKLSVPLVYWPGVSHVPDHSKLDFLGETFSTTSFAGPLPRPSRSGRGSAVGASCTPTMSTAAPAGFPSSSR